MIYPNNVTEIIVSEDLCSGCGVCAGICPSGCLEMHIYNGMYRPALVGKCSSSCNLCLSICPFYDHDVSRDDNSESLFGEQDGIQHDRVTGYYLQGFIGHSLVAEHRARGASGGMATWVLEHLLISGEVDRVIAVGPVSEPGLPFFKAEIYADVNGVRRAASSKYCPIEMSTVLRNVLRDSDDHHYVIVGLPCVLQAIRRAMLHYPLLARRVRYLLGLVCDHCPGHYYTEFLCCLANVSTEQVRAVGYRFKESMRANDYQFRAFDNDGWSCSVGFQGLPSRIWVNRYFSYRACNYCDDVFAEVADVVFMDAWLEDYIRDTSGNSLILVRDPRIAEIIKDGIQRGLCELAICSIDTLINSQKEVVLRKKEDIKYRILERLNEGRWLPNTHLPLPHTFSRTDMRLARQEARTIRLSVTLWRLFRWIPSSLLPVYCWLVDRLAGRSFKRPVTAVLKRSLVRISKKVRLYKILKKLS